MLDLEFPLAFGLLRLCAEGRPDETAAVDLICHALDQGVRVLDTADSYSLGARDMHYGEHLARKAVAEWGGAADTVKILTKAGLTRPKGRWVPNSSPEHLRKTIEGSLRNLGVDSIPTLLLHVRDPRRPFEETLAALAKLQQEGKIQNLGLCNTSVPEILQASRHFSVTMIQNELNVMDRKSATDGVLAYAKMNAIPFLAHRPLGGHGKVTKLAGNRAIKPIVQRHGITPYEAAFAVIANLGKPVIPLLGATRRDSLDSSLRAARIQLDAEDWAALRQRISFAARPQTSALLAPPTSPSDLAPLERGKGPGFEPEVVMVMGIQGAGKSSLVSQYVEAGYIRLNRDLLGGSLADLVPILDDALLHEPRVVLDNTYPTQSSRCSVIRIAHAHGVPVRCKFIATPYHDAMLNVVGRVLDRYDRLPGPDELKSLARTDPNLPPLGALKRWQESFEVPSPAEGFSMIETVPFIRRPQPGTKKALLLDVDGTIRTTQSGEKYPRHPDDVVLLPNRREVLSCWLAEGYALFFVSNQSGISSGKVSQEAVDAAFARTVELLDLPVVEVTYCPHKAFPVTCFCRKPYPGLGVMLTRKHGLDLHELVMVGDRASDGEFARALGATYHEAEAFFQL